MTYKRKDKLFKYRITKRRAGLLRNAVLTDVREIVLRHMNLWATRFPTLGPCWPIARVLANAKLGRVEYCQTYCRSKKEWYGHCIVRTPQGVILDCSGEYICQSCAPHRPLYRNFMVFNDATHDAYPEATLRFWKRRLT